MSKESLEKLRKRAYMTTLGPPEDSNIVVTGGWKIIHGERRLVPLSAHRRKPRHCASCLYFRKASSPYCALTGSFVYKDTEACDSYVNRTWKNE